MRSQTTRLCLPVCLVLSFTGMSQSQDEHDTRQEGSTQALMQISFSPRPQMTESAVESLRSIRLKCDCTQSFHGTFASPLYALDLQGCAINDADCELIAEIVELEELKLVCTRITNGAIHPLCRLKNLRWLDLRGTRVTDDGILKLTQAPRLEMLDLRGTKVTADGVQELRLRRPKLRVLVDLRKSSPNFTSALTADSVD
ncbi:Leucine Rich repeats (2 copies) [Thalassoglobus neptunius]|uniref:Leucine Rich repeats (2 copies) n=1 Tax=Thalassoglobus neptunius TaxID=1938619 RepID=A0A5C5X6V5_9PLAN|nr:hypothetical protein [Thalassoglobus neptunius]TWT58847.1 Leucine Rich repeats (2 copies) [Thalassoglobus neptunius]